MLGSVEAPTVGGMRASVSFEQGFGSRTATDETNTRESMLPEVVRRILAEHTQIASVPTGP